MRDYAVFDLETTGFSSADDAITEIGWLVVRDGVPEAVQSRLIYGTVCVPDEVSALTGITDWLLATEGVSLTEALDAFLTDTAGLPLVGHNIVRFDAPFLEAACQAVSCAAPDRGRYVDTAALFVARCLGRPPAAGAAHFAWAGDLLRQRRPGLRYNLGAACDALVIERGDVTAHRAAADCVLTQRLYAALCPAGEAVPV